MTTAEKKDMVAKVTAAVARLISANMNELGMNYEKAMDAAYNRFNKEYPTVLAAYISAAQELKA